jgi:hypothetical protein
MRKILALLVVITVACGAAAGATISHPPAETNVSEGY